jgi:D-alanyl-D-alanine carboxypeptidase
MRRRQGKAESARFAGQERKIVKLSALFFAACAIASTVAHAAEPPAYVLIDADKATVLADHEADTLWYPASLTKLMTAYVTFSALQSGRITLKSPVRVSQNALDQPPSKMGFAVGTVMTVDNALKMLLVKSANDIAVAIAEAVAGRESTFVAAMNNTAAQLGMASTHYNNPHGLPDPGQVTTARDMAVLARALWADFPEYRPYLGIPAIKSGKTILTSENRLLERYRGTNGMKTGFTCSAGYNLIASATRDGQTFVAVVLGEDSWNDVSERAAGLLARGFNPVLRDALRSSVELASIGLAPSAGPAVDMRDHGICKGGKDETDDFGEGSRSSLEPRFVLMAPVVVTTGGADGGKVAAPAVTKTPATAKPAAPAVPPAAKPLPTPRMRPAPGAVATSDAPARVIASGK